MNAAALHQRIDAAPFVAGNWHSPDMSILSGGRTTPPVMPDAMFGALWPLIRDLAEGAGAPVDYVAIGVLGAAASLIGSTRRVQPFDSEQWREPCILWTAAVGDPSSNKSPGLDAATGPLRAMELDLAEQFKSRLVDYETLLERSNAERGVWKKQVEAAVKDHVGTPSMPAAAEAPEKPSRPRLLVQDATPEALGEILSGNPRGVLHMRDELAGWLMSFERYSPGGREFWLEAYGGRAHTIDRKSQAKPLLIPFNGVSVIGGIQPEKLADCLLDVADDGLVARFLWAWPDPIPYRRPTRIADIGLLEHVYRKLHGLQGRGEADGEIVRLDADAADIFEAWIQDAQAASVDAAPLYKGFLGKLRGMALRVALVVQYLAWASDDDPMPAPSKISAATLVAVLDFIDSYAKPAALRVFGDAALPASERNAALLARFILRTKAQRINAREVRRTSGISTLKQAQDVDAAVEALAEADWLRPAGERDGDTKGRAKKDFIVNPQVHRG